MWPCILETAVAALGLGSLVWAVILSFRTRAFIRCALETTGEVVRLERSKNAGRYGRYDYAPVFCFRAADGKSHTVTSEIGSSPPGFEVGDVVQVRYDPANPGDARIETLLQTWGGTIVYGIIGAIAIGYVIFESARSIGGR